MLIPARLTLDGFTPVDIRTKQTSSVLKLKEAVAAHLGLADFSRLVLEYQGHRMDDIKLLSEYRIGHGVTVQATEDPLGVPLAERASSARPKPPSPPSSTALTEPVADIFVSPSATFDPRRAHIHLTPSNSVILPFAALAAYLARTLRALTLSSLDAEQFNQFFQPYFQALDDRGLDIAITFLPQRQLSDQLFPPAEEEPATALKEVVTRAFLLFGGVKKGDGEWDQARRRGSAGVGDVDWRAVVGIGPEVEDRKVVQTLQWGGLEASL